MEILNVVLDIVLVLAGVWMIITVRNSGLGGVIGDALSMITIGAGVLGLAHLIETITVEWLNMGIVLVEFIHRILVLIGFVLLILGFRSLSKLRISPQ